MEGSKGWWDDGYILVSVIYLAYIALSLIGIAVGFQASESVYLVLIFSIIPVLLVIVMYLIWKREWKQFGFHLSISNTDFLLYMPLLMLLLIVGWDGFYALEVEMVLFYGIYAILTGFIQETFFRSILIKQLEEKGTLIAVLIPSFLYTFVLWFQFYGGQGFFPVFQLVMLSFLFAVVMSQVFLLTRNIIPLIIFHCFFSFFQFISKEMNMILTVVYLLYLILLIVFYYYVLKNRKEKL